MAKSEILKKLAKNEIDIESILKLLKLLLVDLGKEELIKWIDYEIEGYPYDAKLPDYRVYNGILKGSFVSYGAQCNNIALSLKGDTPKELREKTKKIEFRQGIGAIKKLDKSNTNLVVEIPGEMLHMIELYSMDPISYLLRAYIEVSSTVLNSIISKIENKVMDILLELEKEFGCLDDISIDISDIDTEDIERIINNITIIIYDNHIELGDNNKILKSNFNAE